MHDHQKMHDSLYYRAEIAGLLVIRTTRHGRRDSVENEPCLTDASIRRTILSPSAKVGPTDQNHCTVLSTRTCEKEQSLNTPAKANSKRRMK